MEIKLPSPTVCWTRAGADTDTAGWSCKLTGRWWGWWGRWRGGGQCRRHPWGGVWAETVAAIDGTPTCPGPTGTRRKLLLKVFQLTHEVEVGRDVGLAFLDKVVRVVEREAELLHEVCHSYSHRAAHTSQTVDKDTRLGTASFVCRQEIRRTNIKKYD